MNLDWSPEDRAFRDEIRAFIDAELTPEMRAATARMTSVYAPVELSMPWQAKLHARGWAAPAWPREYGGPGWSQVQRYIFAREMAEAGAPPLSPMGIGMCGPVLIGHGTPEQKAHWLPRMLNGDDLWCQGYSETESGSDLASLRMKAVRDGDHFVCTGHKLWTTHGHKANMIFCLVRTSVLDKPQKGITFLLIDMKAPGVSVRPILSLSGEHVQNHITFDEVRVPIENVVGEVDDGWTVAKYLMEFERGGSVYSPSMRTRVDRLRQFLREEGAETPGMSRRLSLIMTDIEALDAFELQFMSSLSTGGAPGVKASMLKVLGTELSQRLTELELEGAGLYASAWQPHLTTPGGDVPGFVAPGDNSGVGSSYTAKAVPKYLNDRAGSIYAGTNEIQRGILWQAMERSSR
ncbi:MAG: acyl-CoA dehydrogenase family protein [Novosphingobium sp.]